MLLRGAWGGRAFRVTCSMQSKRFQSPSRSFNTNRLQRKVQWFWFHQRVDLSRKVTTNAERMPLQRATLLGTSWDLFCSPISTLFYTSGIRGPILIWNGELPGHEKICARAVFAQIKITLPAAHCECSSDCELAVIANDRTLEHTWKQFMSPWTSDCPSTCFQEV